VVGRDPTTWWRAIQVNLGSRDNLKTDQVVMTGAGLVGRVSQAGISHSQVALVGDAECGVAVVVKETRDLGIIKPGQTLSGDGGLVEMTLLQNCPGIMAGQVVLTSGLGGVFPAGLPVGTIVDTRNEDGNVFTTARVRLAANLNRLEEVWVLQP
jgi:rod shape-determining protein MreC